jgi:hypothetical protein
LEINNTAATDGERRHHAASLLRKGSLNLVSLTFNFLLLRMRWHWKIAIWMIEWSMRDVEKLWKSPWRTMGTQLR